MAAAGRHDEVSRLLAEAKHQRSVDPNASLFPQWKNTAESSPSDDANLFADVMSVSETRRIRANQNPAGAFACNVCKGLDFRRGMPSDAEVVFFIGLAAMSSTAAGGCHGCQFLSDCLKKAGEVYLPESLRGRGYGEFLWGDKEMKSVILHSAALGAPLYVNLCAGPSANSPCFLEFSIHLGS